MPEKKTAHQVWGAAYCTPKHAYPDTAFLINCGNGTGFGHTLCIIHDFFSYNNRVIRRLGDQLEAALSGRDMRLLRLVARAAQSLGLPLYMVGGLPRDLALGRAPSDFDLVVEGSAIQLAASLAAKHGGRVTAHPRFGTAKWHLEDLAIPWWSAPATSAGRYPRAQLDLISARSEAYNGPAQLPQVRPGTIEDDLQRRDFTINTLAIRLDGRQFGRLLDPLGAMEDMQRGAIRVLHDKSFMDDPTRIFRAVRYEQRLGFIIVSETLRLMTDSRRWIGLLSAHRLRQELDQILGEDRAAAMVHRLGGLGLLRAVHRSLPADRGTIRRLESGQLKHSKSRDTVGDGKGRTRRWLLWLMDLSPAQIKSVRQRLQFDNRLAAELLAASGLRRSIKKLIRFAPSVVSEQLKSLPLPAVEAVFWSSAPGAQRQLLKKYLTTWQHVRTRTTGADLKALGILPSPAYRVVLQALRAAWIDGRIRTAAEEKHLLEELVGRLNRSESHGAAKSRGRRESRET
jgi:tRNA nucleotidyltransferase (CCA-adding enzyme)